MSGVFNDLACNILRDAALPMRTSGGAKWPFGLSASGRSRTLNHAEARQNARNAMHDSVQARAVVERAADTIYDGGLRLEIAPIIGILGISRDQATRWASDVMARFDLWAKDKKQHRAENLTWYQAQGMWALFRQRDNDQFVRMWYDNNPRLQNPLQWDFLDPDMIRWDAYTSTGAFNSLDDGILRDERGRETGYKVWLKKTDKDSNVTYEEVTLPRVYPGGRVAMLHGYKPEYAGQGRGYSKLAHAIQEFENITDFSAATIKKAINQSSIVAFVEPSKDEDSVNPMAEIMAGQAAGPAAQLFGQVPAAVSGVDVAVPPDALLANCGMIPEATLQTPGSMFIGNLTKGSTIKFPQNSAPGDSYDKFVDAFTAYIAASCNIPLEVVLMKFGQNYSASRATLLLFWRVCVIERQEMATDFLNPTVEMWLAGEIAAGRVQAPGWSDPRLRAAWLNCQWIGSGPPDIDPAKSAKACRENLEIGRTNVEREARDFNGTSAADNIATNNAVFKGYRDLPWNAPAPIAAPGKPAKAAMEDIRAEIEDYMEENS